MEKTIINEKDFETYEMVIPPDAIFGKKRKKFIFSNLERNHPCFSEKDYFESRLQIGKKGVIAKVFVVDKVKLAEYRALNPGKKLICEIHGKGFEIGRKKIRTLGVLLLITLSVVTGSVVFWSKKSSLPGVSDELDSKAIIETNQNNLDEDEINMKEKLDICKEFFEVVKASKGVITSFIFNENNQQKKITASLKGMYPEKFSFLEKDDLKFDFSSVRYLENGETEFSVNVIQHKQKGSNEKNENWRRENIALLRSNAFSEVRKDFRNLIIEEKGTLQSEKVIPFEMVFSIGLLNWNQFFGDFEQMLIRNQLGLNEVSISLDGEGKNQYLVKVGICESFGLDENLLELLLQFESVFIENKTFVYKEIKDEKKDFLLKPLKKQDLKIGEIKHKNGEKIIFYLNDKGKMYKQSEGNNFMED